MPADIKKPKAAGKSSFDLIDTEKFFRQLDLQKGSSFLDLACGRGAYSLAASKIVGENGSVVAIDLWQEGIEFLKAAAAEKKAHNIKSYVNNAARRLPVDDHSIDVCLMATVLHDFVEAHIHKTVLDEMVRVVKPSGILAVMEFKKIDGPPGPPRPIRLSPEEVVDILTDYDFTRTRLTDVGAFNYMMLFKRA